MAGTVSDLINTKLDGATKGELSRILNSAAKKDATLLQIANAIDISSPGIDTLVQIAQNLKAGFGADSLEGKFMDYLISQVHNAHTAGGTEAQVLSAARRAVSRYEGGEPFTQRELGNKDFRRTNDRVALAMFGGSGSKLIQNNGKLGTLSQDNFKMVQKAAKGEALPEQIDGMDRAAWEAQYGDFILMYKDVTHESGCSPSREMFGHMVEGQVSNINKANLSDEQKQQLVREARGRMDTNYQGIGGSGDAAKTEKAKDSGNPAKSSKISKCPYRALALAMKMINQLAEMMCSSFQKSIGANGFYKGLTTDEFNQLVGFGQRNMERGEDLAAFFGLTIDNKGKIKVDKDGNIIFSASTTTQMTLPDGRTIEMKRDAQKPDDKVMEALFANVGFAEVYKKLEIKADPKIKDPTQQELDRQKKMAAMDSTVVRRAKWEVFADKILTKPQEVERAMRYVTDSTGKKLSKTYEEYQEKLGYSKYEREANKKTDMGIQQFDLDRALHDLRIMAAGGDAKAKKAIDIYDAAKQKADAEGGYVSLEIQDGIITFHRDIKNSIPELQDRVGESPKIQAAVCEVDTEILFNKVEIERLKKKGRGAIDDKDEDVEYLVDRNAALKKVAEGQYTDEQLKSLDVNQEATAHYIRMVSERIMQKLAEKDKLTESELRFVERVFGELAEELTSPLTAAGPIPPRTMEFLQRIAKEPQKLINCYSGGKPPRDVGVATDPKPRGAQTYRRTPSEMEGRLGDVFEIDSAGRVGDPDELIDDTPVKDMTVEYQTLKEAIGERERQKPGGMFNDK